MNTYHEIETILSIILKDGNATKFTLGVKGVTEFRNCYGSDFANDPHDYDVEVWADGKPYTRIASEFIAAVIFKEAK